MDSFNSGSPDDEAAHAPRLVSHGSIGHVTLCGCGHLHLTLQHLTLRFEPDAFRELASLLALAQRRLDTDARLRADDSSEPRAACGAVH
jgi:hypothetical protein